MLIKVLIEYNPKQESMLKKCYFYVISFVFSIIIIISCNNNDSGLEKKNYTVKEIDGVKVFKNKNKPSVKDVDLKPREIFTISGQPENSADSLAAFPSVASIAVDSKENIYVLDFRSSSVKKFNKKGKFVKSFGKRGNGPGEFTFAESITINNDTIGINDFQSAKIVQFDSNGNFIRNRSVQAQSRFKDIIPVGKGKYIANLTSIIEENNAYFFDYNVLLLNQKFEKIKSLRNFKQKYNPDKPHCRLDMYDPYVVGDNKIFVPVNSDLIYRIDVYNFDGNKLYSIDKNYRRVEFLESEKTAYDSLFRLNRRGTPPLTVQYKKAINFIYHDNKGRLLAASSIERNKQNMHNLYFDVFKDGVFLNQVQLNLHDSYDFMNFENRLLFNNDKIYHLNSSNSTISVYKY